MTYDQTITPSNAEHVKSQGVEITHIFFPSLYAHNANTIEYDVKVNICSPCRLPGDVVVMLSFDVGEWLLLVVVIPCVVDGESD